jgi:putative transposase
MDILALLQGLSPELTPTTVRHFQIVITALLVINGRVTMLGLSRWTGKGGSYRTLQRFYNTTIPWAVVFWQFFRQHLWHATDVYILAGDECVVPKAGTHTHGLDRFFSSLYGRPIPGLAFFCLALISVQERRAYPLQVQQLQARESCKGVVPPPAKPLPPPTPRPVGRPKGSKNRDKTAGTLTPELQLIQAMVQKLLKLLQGSIPLTYLVLDGAFGHHNALNMAQQCGLQLISKLRADAALYLPYTGPYGGRGPRRKYGARLQYTALPSEWRCSCTVTGRLQTEVYQGQAWHKSFATLLKVVILVKTHLDTGAQAHVILFSSDLELAADTLVEYYRLRFQIEFVFRDAKQYWGLDDFMNVNETPVTNAANLALFMVNVAYRLLPEVFPDQSQASVLDLQAYFRGRHYVTAILKWLPEKLDPVLLAQLYAQVTALGQIHPVQAPADWV